MQEELEQKSVNLLVSTGKLTGKTFLAIVGKANAFLKDKTAMIKGKIAEAQSVTPRGKQSVRQLVGQDQGVANLEINNKSINRFERIARKYGVDFAVKRTKGDDGKSKYLVFFKGRDADALTSAFREYTDKELKRNSRPSVLEKLDKFKDMVKPAVGREKRLNLDR